VTIADAVSRAVTTAFDVTWSEGTAVVWNGVVSGLATDAGIDADAVGRTWRLSGVVSTVLWPADVRTLLVVSRSRPIAGRDRGIRVHRIAADAPGVVCRPRPLLDGSARHLELDDVVVTDADAVGPKRDATVPLSQAMDHICLAATVEMHDAARDALDLAVAWVSQREQFGAPLAMRQAVQHRAADMAMACAAVRALLDDAHEAARRGSFGIEAAIAKLVASSRLPDVTAGAHQLHGGEGYYSDRPLHGYHRRVCTLAALFGNALHQRARLVALLAE
jgi:alkylation response protein AidB-like acyl-CoA dehydrogenase